MSIPTMRLGRKKNSPPASGKFPERWEQLLEEHDRYVKELGDAFQVWLERHQKTVQESKRWKEARDQLARELRDTKMKLESTKTKLCDLQHKPGLLPGMNQHCNKSPRPKTLPIVLRNAAHIRKQGDYSFEAHDKSSKESNQSLLFRELQSKMVSYQVILRWQERQTEQWRSRCNRQFNKIESLVATVERQKIELEQEKEHCDVLIDTVYHLVKQKEEEEEDLIQKPDEQKQKLKDSTHKDDRPMPTYPEEFLCPLTQQVFVDPVIDHEGNTYEKKAIVEWLELNETSPLTRNLLCKDQLIANRVVKQMIAAWHGG